MKESIRLRSILLGLTCGLAICAVTPYNNMYLRATLLGGGHFPLAPFFILAWLTLIVAGIARLTRTRPLLSGLELLVAFALMVLVSGIPYTGLTRTFFINLSAPDYLQNLGNRWVEVIHPLLPDALYPQDSAAIAALHDGLPRASGLPWYEVLTRIPWVAWLGPLCWWGLFIGLAYAVMICLVNILGRQWVVNERINFPLLRLPMAMTEALDEQRFFSFLTDRYLLFGLSVPVFLHLVNGLNAYFPDVPAIPTFFLFGNYFPKYGLFSGFNKLRIHLYPAFIGFAFLTSRQISFSLWFFFLLGGLLFGALEVFGLTIPAAALGTTFGPTLASAVETQMIGAYGVFFLFVLWLARFHLAAVCRGAFGRGPVEPPETEWFSLRASFWGFWLGLAGLVAWCMLFGVSFLVAVVVMLLFLGVSLVASRVICQGGIAYFTLTAAPLDGILGLFGSKFFGQTGLLLSAVTQKVLFLDLRESLLPSLFHAAKIGEHAKNKRLMLVGILAVVVLGAAVSFAAMLVLAHKIGLRELELDWATRTTVSVYDNVQRLLDAPQNGQSWVMIFSVVGALVMLVLVLCYHRFYWWPIHPIGYLATYSSSLRILWFSFFVGWLVNQLALRYGGVALFSKVRYFFFGLILGDFLMGGMWAVIGLYTGTSYMVLPD